VKICLVAQEYPPETAKGGIGTQTYRKAHGLTERGHEIWVLSRSPTAQRTERSDGRVTVVRIPAPAERFPVHTEIADWILYSAEVAVELGRLQARIGFDLVDFPEWACEGYGHLLNRDAWNAVPVVIQLHGPLVMFAHTMGWPALDSEFYRTGTHMEGTCLRLADAVYSSSRCSAEWYGRHYEQRCGTGAAAVPVIHTGVDTTQFAPQSVAKAERPTILCVGRIARTKGVFDLLEAAAQVAPDVADLRVRLLGRGEPAVASELRQRAAALGRPQLLDLAGYVGQADLPAELARAHVFAMPSVYEGGPGFVYLEAMACGLPVIACAGSGAAECVQHGETGLLVPAGDVATLARTLRSVLSNRTEGERLGVNARQWVVSTADSRRCLDRLEEFYQAVVRRGPRGSER
jgi:glycosyltransferase involved in cell wall biosynthesis